MKILCALVLVVCVRALVGCGGDGGGGTSNDVQNAAARFANPDGTLTDANSNEAVLEALRATRAFESGQGAFGTGVAAVNPAATTDKAIEDCIVVDGLNVTIQYSCFAEAIGEESGVMCTGSGSVTSQLVSSSDTGFVTNYQYNNASLSCDGAPAISCNGTGSGALVDNIFVNCIDLVCTQSGASDATEGCFSTDIDTGKDLVLVTLDDGSVVCLLVVANSDCTRACSEWRDAEGDAIITCDVTETSGTCDTDAGTIEDVANCQVDRSQSTCDGF